MKQCATCKESRPFADFYRNRTRADGFAQRCKPCTRAHTATTRDARKEWERAYFAQNRERLDVYRDKYRAENRDRLAEQQRMRDASRADYFAAYREEFRDKRKAYAHEYAARNRPQFAEKRRRRTAQILRATPPWADLNAIREFYEDAARLCLETGYAWEVDHLYPLKGKTVCGLHNQFNLRVITKEENRSKGSRLP